MSLIADFLRLFVVLSASRTFYPNGRLVAVSLRDKVVAPSLTEGKTMKEHDFQNRFQSLMDDIKDLPESQQQRLMKLANETKERHQALTRSFDQIRQDVGRIRMNMKYNAFDLEATKRERDALTNHIRDRSGGQDFIDDRSDWF